jgi:hypothetical protein
MALATYTDLLAAVGNWLDRADLATNIPDFITLAEARFNRLLRTVEMEARSTATSSSSALALPSDFIGVRSIRIANVPLSFVTAADFFRLNITGPTNPYYYTIAQKQFFFLPPPTAAVVEIDYYQKIPALTAGNPTNWLMTKAPDVYLYGTLLQASAFLVEDARVPLWKAALDSSLAEMDMDAERNRFSAAPLAPRIGFSG